MQRSPGRLVRENLASCFSNIVQLSYHNWSYSSNIEALIENPDNQILLDPTCENICNQSSIRDSSHFDPKTGETSVLASCGLQHWLKNWQEQRKHKLTASTFGLAVGFFPRRRVQLWQEKIGVRDPFSGSLATCWSNIKEEEALERYKLITGNTVFFPKFQIYGKKSSEDSWLAASPDGAVDRVVYELPSRGVLEIKCPYFKGDMSQAYPWKRVPLFYVPQAQGLMEIMDRDWMDFYVWTTHGSSLFRLYRDETYWDVLKMALSDFWWKHVQPAKEMYSKFKDCKIEKIYLEKQLQLLKPAPRHELCRYLVYESKCIADNAKLLIREINGKLID